VKFGIHAVAARHGGGRTYLDNVIPAMCAELSPAVEELHLWFSAWDPPKLLSCPALRLHPLPVAADRHRLLPASRLIFDQVTFRRAVKRNRLSSVFATANFGMIKPPCRQVLLVRNTLPFDRTLLARLSPAVRAVYGMQRQLTLASLSSSEVGLFPSAAMRNLVAEWVDRLPSNWEVAHYGVDQRRFTPRPASTVLNSPVRLLNVSTYSEQKNFRTLLKAMSILADREPHRYHLSVTAGFARDALDNHPSFPAFRADKEQFAVLARRGIAVDHDWQPYDAVSNLYSKADLFVFPSFTESFGHPLVEAMASGLPIVASDIPVNRELCADAAVYFPAFDAEALADAIAAVTASQEVRLRLRTAGLRRVEDFSWTAHSSKVLLAMGMRT
jgi:glycosyltransferase involved in cell wall biosynthesis